MFIIFGDKGFARQETTTCSMWTAMYASGRPKFPFLKGRLALETRVCVSEAWKEIPKFLGLIYQHSEEIANL